MSATKLGMKKAHREHSIRNAVCSLILYEQIETTEAKSKVIKPFVDKILSAAKANNLHARRQVIAKLFDKNATDKIFSELIARYESRNSGFVRSFRLGRRLGDNTQVIRLELVDKKVFVEKDAAPKSQDVKTEVKKDENVSAKKKA
ncbi:MAG: 50S ribosomal protein L17 [bacterium ADurb.BinA186]|nr:MAG: 50S ribosomal protein L17 [bacterium ADurb.BinA186]